MIHNLVKALLANSGESRRHVAEALRSANDEVTMPLLIAMINGEDRAARLAGIEALGHTYGTDRGVAALIALFRRYAATSDVETARAAAQALGNTNDERAVKPLLEALSTSNDDLRGAIVTALGLIGDERAVAPLKALQARGKSSSEVEVALSNIKSRNGEE